jgi:hypothetical protein
VARAWVRTVLGDDPHTVESEHEAELVPGLPDGVVGVEVGGMGHVLVAPSSGDLPDRAMFTRGQGTERDIDVVRGEDGRLECTVVKNSRGQRRLVVAVEL